MLPTGLSGNLQRPIKVPPGGLRTVELKLAGYTNYGSGTTAFTVYKGAFMMCDVSDTDGYFSPVHGTPATGDIFGGIAMDHVAVTAADAADGSKQCSVLANGVVGVAKGSVAITDLGATIYASDDGTGITTATDGVAIGTLEDVDDTYAWINIESAFMGLKA